MNIGGLDIGTTGCKLTVYREDGTCISTVYQAYDETERFKNQQVEAGMMDAGVIFDAVGTVIQKTTETLEVHAIGVTSFGETFVMLDEKDQVLLPSILYYDSRGVEECAVFEGRQVEKITGVQPAYLFSLPKLMWVKKHYPERYAAARHVLLMQDFIVYMLTGKAQIDYSLASRTLGFDIRNKCWSQELFDLAGLDIEKMSEPVPSGTIAGKTNLFGLKDTVVVSGAMDQIAAALGAGVLDASVAMDGIGTVECILPVLKEIPENPAYYEGGYAVIPYVGENTYASCIFSYSGGASIKWYRDSFMPGVSYGELNDKVNTNEPTGLLLLPHFSGAATPYMDTESRAAIVGLSYDTNRDTLYQAVLEGITYEILLNMEIAEKNQSAIERFVATGGGAKSPELLQIKANVYNRPVTSLEAEEVGAMGDGDAYGHCYGGFP